MPYQNLTNHPKQYFRSIDEIKIRYKDIKDAMHVLIQDIHNITLNHLNTSSPPNPVVTLLRIRTGSRPKKSYYECMNQLIHYSYCLIAANALMNTGRYSVISILPTAKNNNKGFDIRARSNQNGSSLIGEVFCTSESLFQSKKSISIKKLSKHKCNTDRVIFINAGATFSSLIKTKSQLLNPIFFYSIDIPGNLIIPIKFSTHSASHFGNALNLQPNINL